MPIFRLQVTEPRQYIFYAEAETEREAKDVAWERWLAGHEGEEVEEESGDAFLSGWTKVSPEEWAALLAERTGEWEKPTLLTMELVERERQGERTGHEG